MIHGVVSVIIPTAGRATLDAALESLYATTYLQYPVQAIVVTNGGYNWLSWEHDDNETPFWSTTIVPANYFTPGAIAAWNNGLDVADGEYVVMAADDLVFQEGWLTEALEALPAKGCVGFNDMHNGERHQTHFLMHRSFIVNYLGGCLVAPVYHHYYCDNELVARAKRANLYAYAEKSLVRHDHWANQRRPFDQWDESVKQYFLADEKLFLERQAAGFPDDFSPVITA